MGTLVLVEKGTVFDGTADNFMSRHSACSEREVCQAPMDSLLHIIYA